MRSSSSYLMLSSDPVGAPALHLKAALYFTLKDKHKMVIFVVESCCQNGMNSWSRDGWRQLRNLSKSPHCVFFYLPDIQSPPTFFPYYLNASN